jgi:hypothetical protein
MPDVELLAVLVAALAAFAVGTVWYGIFGAQLVEARGQSAAAVPDETPPWKIAVELVRSLLVAGVLAGLAVEAGIDTVAGGLALGAATWIGFPVVLLGGSVLWENVSPRLAAIHAGDWLAKLLAIAVIVSVWQ